LVEPDTGGDPMGETRWLNCRLADVAAKLDDAQAVSLPVISRLLHKHHYRLRVNHKTIESTASHPDRNQQFEYLRQQRAAHQAAGQPTLSIDTKKKELIGNFKQPGRIWGRQPESVNVHDFPNDALGRAVPYGIYDLQQNRGNVYVGQSADTPEFAVDNLVRWCESEMPRFYPHASMLFLEADGGGSNGVRCRLWKQQLQAKIADRFGLTVTVSHYPTGCSKWNPIEHRLFSEVSKTCAGCPLRSYDLLLHYLCDTTTKTGLTVEAMLVTSLYTKGIKVSNEELAALNLQPHAICPQWNYTISPRSQQNAA
jgi:Rhodopirellula transposase DDE domain